MGPGSLMHGAPLRLRCEYLDNPIGIHDLQPRLSWWPDDPRPAELQTAFHVLAASRVELLALDEGDLWDSGRVESPQTCNVPYRGKQLVSGRRVWWKVRTYDSDGLPSHWSEVAFFEAGVLAPEQWRGSWIHAPLTGSRASSVPVPALRRVFELGSAPAAARLHLSALGLFHAEINGVPVTRQQWAPGWVDYATAAPCVSYDVTALLQAGGNTLGVLLGDGWFCGRTGLGERQHYGERPELYAQLNVILESGASLVLCTDSQWQWRPSWILSSDLQTGESVDLRQHDPRWSCTDSGAQWYPVITSARRIPLRADISGGVSILAEQPGRRGGPAAQSEPTAQGCLFRFDTPLLGRARVRAVLSEGASVRVRYGLEATPEGGLIALSEDVYSAAGLEDGEELQGTFSQHGFQYVEVSGDIYRPESVAVVAEPIGIAAGDAAEFSSDRVELNQLFDRLTSHLRQTMQAVPFAGLAPRERVGDLAAFGARVRAALLTLDVAAPLRKWMQDLADAQLADGGFPASVPAPPDLEQLSVEGSAGCSDAFAQCLWELFRLQGDRTALEIHYPAVREFLGGLKSRCADGVRGEAPGDVHDTLWYYRSIRLAVKMAGVLGRLGDLEEFEALAAKVRNAFRRRFVTADARLVGEHPALYAAALRHGLLDRREQQVAAALLQRQVERADGREVLTAPLAADLLPVLTQLGRCDLASHLLLGATGCTEDQLLRAGVIEWLMSSLVGMDLGRELADSHNAFRHLRVQPRPSLGGWAAAQSSANLEGADSSGDAMPGSATASVAGPAATGGPPVRMVEAAMNTVSGRFEVAWQISDEAFELQVLVPCNCTADVILPDDTVHEVVAGRHAFTAPFRESGDGIPVLREVSGAL